PSATGDPIWVGAWVVAVGDRVRTWPDPPVSALASGGERLADPVELAGGAEGLGPSGDEGGEGVDEFAAGTPQVEVARLVAEVLAMDTGPDEPAIGIGVDLADAKRDRALDRLDRDAPGARIESTARGVDAPDLVCRDGARAVEDEGQAGEPVADRVDPVEAEPLFPRELVRAVRGPDRDGQSVAPGRLHEGERLVRVGQVGMRLVDRDVLLDAAQDAELGLDTDPGGVRPLDDAAGDRDVLREGFV